MSARRSTQVTMPGQWFVIALMVGTWMLATTVGCATVGPAVPKLSSDVGDRIAEMRSLHDLALRRMFDGERRRVDTFMDERWIPTFLRNYIGMSGIVQTVSSQSTISAVRELELAEALKGYLSDTTEASGAARAVARAVEGTRSNEPATIRRELDAFIENRQLDAATGHVSALLGSADPAVELLEWARQGQIRIEAERRGLHAPIDEAEERALTELGRAYDELIAAQSALTARMQAAARVKEVQDDALRTLGVKDSYERVRRQALSVGAGVGKAIDQLEVLARNGQIGSTSLGETLRKALEPARSDSLK